MCGAPSFYPGVIPDFIPIRNPLEYAVSECIFLSINLNACTSDV